MVSLIEGITDDFKRSPTHHVRKFIEMKQNIQYGSRRRTKRRDQAYTHTAI